MSVSSDLLALTADEAAHGARLEARLRDEISVAGGWIGFARYMQLALYEPGLGYYSAGARKFGAAGDFITAPEVAPVFSRCLAAQCAEVLQALGGGDVLELGAGSGVMAAEMLAELERRGALPRRYLILDVSADLRERQQATLAAAVPHLLPRVEWLDRLPVALDGVVVANEVLDAMPVERFVVRGDQVRSLGVRAQPDCLQACEADAPAALVDAVRAIESDTGVAWPEGYTSEVNLGLAGWLQSLAAAVARGVLLFVDYGLPRREYYAAERRDGTLLCHFRHRFHDDPFARPGLQDITAWVDFTAVAEAGLAAGLAVAGFSTQAHFLLATGLEREVERAGNGLDAREAAKLAQAVAMLMLPGEMGERFKVLALARRLESPLSGFSFRDLAATL